MAILTVILSTTPYGDSTAESGVDFALSATNYGHEVRVVFIEHGVLQLVANQAPLPGVSNIGKKTKLMALYDIDEIYALNSSVQKYKIEDDMSDIATLIDEPQLADIIGHSDHVVRF